MSGDISSTPDNERDRKLRDEYYFEERKLRLQQRRQSFYLSFAIVSVEFLMYFVVVPFFGAYGVEIKLPDGRLVMAITVGATTVLFSLDRRTITTLFRGITISLKEGDSKDDEDN